MRACIATALFTSYDCCIMEPQNPIVEIPEWTATLTESVSRVAIQILEYLPAVPGGIALAFSLGARTTIENLLAAQSITQAYNPGDSIRIGAIEGRIMRITRANVILETHDGQTLIPAKRFSEQESVHLSRTGMT